MSATVPHREPQRVQVLAQGKQGIAKHMLSSAGKQLHVLKVTNREKDGKKAILVQTVQTNWALGLGGEGEKDRARALVWDDIHSSGCWHTWVEGRG